MPPMLVLLCQILSYYKWGILLWPIYYTELLQLPFLVIKELLRNSKSEHLWTG